MSELAFFDSNILVYSDDVRSPEKRDLATRLFTKHLAAKTAVVSLQVLQEYFVASTEKLKLSPEEAQRKVELISKSKIVRFAADDVIAAIELHRLHKISFWDALIVHAARVSGASILFSEDLQAGSKIGGVRVVNPFTAPTI